MRMRVRPVHLGAAVVMLLACVSALPAQTTEVQSPIEMLTGDQKTLGPGYAIGNIAIGDPKVCDFKMLPGRREVMLVAKGQGHTLLTLWDQKGVKRAEIEIDVTSREIAKLKADLVELLRPYPGVQVTGLGSRLALTGTVDTQAQLQTVKAIAQAAGGVQSLVTAREAPASPGGVRSGTSGAVPVRPPAQAPVATSSPRPIPPGAATPVPLGGAAPNGSPTSTGAPGSTVRRSEPLPGPPAAVPVTGGVGQVPSASPAPIVSAGMPAAAPNPPPPNVLAGGAPPPTSAGRPADPRASTSGGPVAAGVEYVLELIETSATAPPPEVFGPQGRSLFKTRVSATTGTAVRQFVSAQGSSVPTSGAAVSGISIGIRPTVQAGRIRTALVIDTNLPIGRTATTATTPWARAQLEFTVSPGETHYLTERDLGALLKPYSMAADSPPGNSPAGGGGIGLPRVTPKLSGDEAQMARALGGLFAGRRGTGSKTQRAPASGPVLLIVITPYLATQP